MESEILHAVASCADLKYCYMFFLIPEIILYLRVGVDAGVILVLVRARGWRQYPLE